MPEQQKGKKKYRVFGFAFLGDFETFNLKLQTLSEMAEDEEWSTKKDGIYDRLRNYIFNTFEKCYVENAIVHSINSDFCLINTGLLTPNSQDIFMLFQENDPGYKHFTQWKFTRFIKESDNILRQFKTFPSPPKYYSDLNELQFDTSKELIYDLEHIFIDRSNRFNQLLLQDHPTTNLSLEDFISIIKDKVNISIKKIIRNPRLVVPTYYHGRINFLIPVNVGGMRLPFTIEPFGPKYKVSTILTKEMAYKNARLVMKPESSWLL